MEAAIVVVAGDVGRSSRINRLTLFSFCSIYPLEASNPFLASTTYIVRDAGRLTATHRVRAHMGRCVPAAMPV
jgi:hypothetical protein